MFKVFRNARGWWWWDCAGGDPIGPFKTRREAYLSARS
jgi:hypothetical protein